MDLFRTSILQTVSIWSNALWWCIMLTLVRNRTSWCLFGCADLWAVWQFPRMAASWLLERWTLFPELSICLCSFTNWNWYDCWDKIDLRYRIFRFVIIAAMMFLFDKSDLLSQMIFTCFKISVYIILFDIIDALPRDLVFLSPTHFIFLCLSSNQSAPTPNNHRISLTVLYDEVHVLSKFGSWQFLHLFMWVLEYILRDLSTGWWLHHSAYKFIKII